MAVKLTKVELVAMLDAKIRRRAGWKFNSGSALGSLGITALDDEAVKKASADVYNDIVADFAYSENIVKATRAVRKFNKAYVRRIIRAGIKDGSVQLEMDMMDKVGKSMVNTEALPPWLKKKVDGKDKDGKDGKGKKKKKGLPPWLKKNKKEDATHGYDSMGRSKKKKKKVK